MYKKIFVIIVSVVTLLSVSILSSCSKTNSKDNAFTLWLYPTGTTEETYKFTLINNTLKVCHGIRKESSSFLDPISISGGEHERKLSDEDLKTLKDFIEKVYDSKSVKNDSTILKDGWNVKYTYKDKSIIQPCYYQNTSKELERLYEEVIRLSPIKVDMRGFA